jgi:hypothetical protein
MQQPIPVTLDFLPSRGLFEAQPPAELFHYTDLDGVAGILGTRSLWLSKVSTLNDTSEISLGVRRFKAQAEETAAELEPAEGAFVRDAAAQLDSFRRTNICVGSFSEERDHLNQWRSYANDGRGIALGFDSHELRAMAYDHDVRLVRCIYDPRLHTRITKDLVALLLNAFRSARPQTQDEHRQLLAMFNTTFLLVAPVIKDHHFGAENEWRLVSMPRSPDDRQLTAILTGNLASVRFILPLCRSEDVRSHIISSVTVGPTLDPENVADAVDVLARHQGFDIPQVRFSRVPYRPKR